MSSLKRRQYLRLIDELKTELHSLQKVHNELTHAPVQHTKLASSDRQHNKERLIGLLEQHASENTSNLLPPLSGALNDITWTDVTRAQTQERQVVECEGQTPVFAVWLQYTPSTNEDEATNRNTSGHCRTLEQEEAKNVRIDITWKGCKIRGSCFVPNAGCPSLSLSLPSAPLQQIGSVLRQYSQLVTQRDEQLRQLQQRYNTSNKDSNNNTNANNTENETDQSDKTANDRVTAENLHATTIIKYQPRDADTWLKFTVVWSLELVVRDNDHKNRDNDSDSDNSNSNSNSNNNNNNNNKGTQVAVTESALRQEEEDNDSQTQTRSLYVREHVHFFPSLVSQHISSSCSGGDNNNNDNNNNTQDTHKNKNSKNHKQQSNGMSSESTNMKKTVAKKSNKTSDDSNTDKQRNKRGNSSSSTDNGKRSRRDIESVREEFAKVDIVTMFQGLVQECGVVPAIQYLIDSSLPPTLSRM